MSAIKLQLPTFGGFTTASNTKAAVRMAAKLCAKYGPVEAERRLAVALACRVANGRIVPPPGLSLGFEMTAVEDGRGGEYALFRPSAESGLSGPTTVTAVFDNPNQDLSVIFLGDGAEGPKTLTASLLVRAVAASAEGLEQTVKRLARQIPPQVHPVFKRTFAEPLRNAVLPPDMDELFLRREAVLTVPAAYAQRRFKSDVTALLEKDPLSPGEAAAQVYACLAGKPMNGPFEGEPTDLLWAAAPFDPGPRGNAFWVSGTPFLFFYLEPYLDREAVEALLALDLDYLLTVDMVLGQAKAQVLARGRSTFPGRDDYFLRKLNRLCRVVKPVTGRDDLVQAHYLFQPGNPPRILFGQVPVGDLRWLIHAFTSNISTLVEDGDVWVGNEASGVRHLVKLGHPLKGGIMHFAAFGEGGVGKTTQLNKIAAQVAGSVIVFVTFNVAADEGFPGIAYAWVVDDREVRTEEAYLDESGDIREGIHLINIPERGKAKARREWLVVLRSDRGKTLRESFYEKVVPLVRHWLETVRIPQDMPVYIRPHESCNMVLFAAFVALMWRAVDPWERNYTEFVGLRDQIKAYLKSLGEHPRCFVIIDDIGAMPPPLGEAGDDARRCVESVQTLIFRLTVTDHKDGFHLGMGCHSVEELDLYLPGTLKHFHRVFFMGRQKEGPIKHRVAVMCDPKRLNEPIATLRTDLSQWPDLLKLLTRER